MRPLTAKSPHQCVDDQRSIIQNIAEIVQSAQHPELLEVSIYPKPYTAVVVWATDVVIERNPDLVMKFVRSTLDIVEHLKADPSYASDLYIKRTNSSKSVADTAVASLNKVLTSSGLGSGHDLVAAAAGNWQFMKESGAVADGISIKMEDVVDNRFLPGK
jgi:ABC-type nitrate/sulfonate/bicarbonate transport system substrate-binding protein